MLSYRKSDAVIAVTQRNAKRRIEITEVNGLVEKTLGYPPTLLIGRALNDFLPERINALITEYVEFDDDANDIGSVLSRVQQFSILNAHGKELNFKLKIVRTESHYGDACFQLVLQDMLGIRKQDAFRGVLADNFMGHEAQDATTGLPDRNSIAKHLELCVHFHNKGELRATFAAIEIDDYASLIAAHGPTLIAPMHQHIAKLAKSMLRSDDRIGSIGMSRLGLILVEAGAESARLVLNRFRWGVSAAPLVLDDGKKITISVSIGFAQVGGRVQDQNLMIDCEATLSARGDQQNLLILVGEVEKRKGEDRRKSAISVMLDRRTGRDRRKES